MKQSLYRRHRFHPSIIQTAVRLYYRFTLSIRDVEKIFAERGIDVSYETIRRWCLKFGPTFAQRIRGRRQRPCPTWHVDEVFLKIDGRQYCLWRAVDAEGEVLDVLLQSRRNTVTANKFLRHAMRTQAVSPQTIVTDKWRPTMSAARSLLPSAYHIV